MAPKYSDSLRQLSFGSKVAEKAKSVEMSAGAKALMFGGQREQMTVATAQARGNDYADAQVQDLYTQNAAEILRDYGPEALANSGNSAKADFQYQALMQRERTDGDVGKDAALDFAGGAAGTIGGTLSLGAEALDWVVNAPGNLINSSAGGELVPEIPSMGPMISRATQDVRGWANDQQSPILKARREQHAIEAELDRADRETKYEGKTGALNWAKATGEAIADTVLNYADDPMMAGSVTVEGLGSFAIPVVAINAVGKARVLSKLRKSGKSNAEAKAFLKTDEGKALLNSERLTAVTPITALTEGGGAVTQAQTAILGMDEETLSVSDEYMALRSQNMSHEDAQYALASDAGKAAAIVGAFLGGASGRVSRQFEVNPFGALGSGKIGSSLVAGGKTATVETVEEGFQEGSNQFASNYGQRTVGLDVGLDEGLGESIGEGMVGGLGITAATAGPGAVLGTAKEVVGTAVQQSVKAAQTASMRISENAPNGLKDQAKAAGRVNEAAAILTAEPEEGAERIISPELSKTIQDAVYLPDDEAKGMIQAPIFETLKKEMEETGKVSRTSAISEMSKLMVNSNMPETARDQISIGLIEAYDKVRQLTSDKTRAEIAALPDGSVEKQQAEAQLEAMKTIEASPALVKAKKQLGSLTEEKLDVMLDFTDIDAGNTDTAKARATISTLEIVGRYKTELAKSEDIIRVLDQISPDDPSFEGLSATKDVVSYIEEARRSLTDRQLDVRQQVFFKDNRENGGKSIINHQAAVMENLKAGRVQEAMDALSYLQGFAQSMSNKVGAYNESMTKGGAKVAFEAFNPRKGVMYLETKKRPFLKPNDINSVDNARTATIDAKLVADLYGRMRQEVDKATKGTDYADAFSEEFTPVDARKLDLDDVESDYTGEMDLDDVLQSEADSRPGKKERRIRKDAVSPNDDSVVDRAQKPVKVASQKEKRELKKRTGGNTPFTDWIKSMGGVDPRSYLGKELRGLGMSRKDLPGLFRKNGRKDFDNLPVSEVEPVLAQTIGDNEGYLLVDGIVSALQSEAAGTPVDTTQDQLIARKTLQEIEDAERDVAVQTQEIIEAEQDAALGNAEAFPSKTEETSNGDRQNSSEEEAEASEQSTSEPSDQSGNSQSSEEDGESLFEEDAGVDDSESGGSSEDDAAGTDGDTSEDVSEEARKRPLKEILIGLFTNSKGVNYLLEHFKLVPKKDVPLLLEQESPFAFAIENMNAPTEVRKKLQEYAAEIMPDLKKLMDQYFVAAVNKNRLKDTNKKGEKQAPKTWLDYLDSGTDVLAYYNAMPMNVARKIDGKFTMDPKIFSAAMMASLSWMVKADAQGIKSPSRKNLAKAFGLDSEAQVTQRHVELHKKGTFLQGAVEDIAKEMEQLLALKSDKDAPVQFTQAMFRGVATAALEVMNKQGLLTVNRDPAVDSFHRLPQPLRSKYASDSAFDKAKKAYDASKVQWNTVTVGTGEQLKESLKTLNKFPDLFKAIYAPQSEKMRYIGKPSQEPIDSVIRQKSNTLSKMQRKVIQKLRKTEHYLVPQMVALADELGDMTLLRLMGYTDLEDKTWNEMDKKSIEGKNLSLINGLKGVRGYQDQITAEGLDENGTPIFFDWAISSVGRLQQQGPVTPQGDKIVREMISATRSNLDLTKENHRKALMLAAAQSLDVSIEKDTHAGTVSKLQGKIDGDYAPLIDVFQQYIQEGSMPVDGNTLIEMFAEAKIDKSTKAVHAILTLAQMKEADSTGEGLTNFQTSLALEYDGKTDGPINALINMATGLFTSTQVAAMAKGGLFLGVKEPISLNDYIAGNEAKGIKKDDQDLYHTAAALFDEKLRKLLNTSEGQDLADLDAVLTILDTFVKPFDYKVLKKDPQDIEQDEEAIGRNMVKNPLTVFLYGSGEKGIAGKVAGEVMDNLHSILSTIADDVNTNPDKSFRDHPAFVGTNLLETLERFDPQIEKKLDNPEKEVWGMADSLTNAINYTISEALSDSINEATGGLRSNMQVLQSTARIQATIFADVYKNELKKKQAGRQVKSLSENELREVFEEASKVAPIYTSGVQEFRVAEGEKGISREEVVSSMLDGLSGAANIPSPSDASVKISPFLIIGTGDGMMMMNIYDGELQDLDRSLPVFDGVEDSLENIEGNSRYINEAVWKGWKSEDVPGMTLKSFMQTIRYMPEKNMSPAVRNAIKEELEGLNRNRPEQIKDLKGLQNELIKMTAQNRARKRAMDSLALSADHMAGADAPYFKDGIRIEMDGYDVDKIVNELNSLYEREMGELRSKARTQNKTKGIQKPDEALINLITPISEETGVPGTRRVQGDALALVIDQANLTTEQEQVLLDVMKNDPQFKEYTFNFGSSEDLTTLRDRDFPGLTDKPVQMGQTIPNLKVAYISNASPETLLHEILHSYTSGRIEDYYADKVEGKHVPQYMEQAFGRLEKLMADFRSMDLPGNKSAATLKSELTRYEGDPVAQMSEFISWFLSNQELIELGKDTEVRSPLARVAQQVLGLLRRVLGIKTDPGKNLFSNIRFNLDVITRLPNNDKLAETSARARTIFDQVYGQDQDLEQIEQKYMTRLAQHIDRVAKTEDAGNKQTALLLAQGSKAAAHARKAGFKMNDREVLAFTAVHAVMSSGMVMNGSVLRQAKRVYAGALEVAPDNKKWAFLSGRGGRRQVKTGQTDLLATFVALSQVHKGFRDELSNMDAPSVRLEQGDPNQGQIDKLLTRIANSVINWMTRMSISRKPLGANAQSQLDTLSAALMEIKDRRATRAEELAYKGVQAANERLAGYMDKASVKATGKLQELRKKTTPTGVSKYVGVALEAASLVTAFGSKSESAKRVGALQEMINLTPRYNEIRALMNDLVGVTDDNDGLLKLMNKVRAEIDAMRQEYRENIPDILGSKFERKLTREEWTELQKAVAYTDLSAIGRQETLDVMKDPKVLNQKIMQAEAEVRFHGGKHANHYMEKSNVLAEWLANRNEVSNNLQRNAYAIAKRAGEQNRMGDKPDEALVDAIDRLTSLYAYQNLDAPVKDRMQELVENEPEGMRFLVGYQHSTRGLEQQKLSKTDDPDVARINGWKGHAAAVIQDGHNLLVRDDSEGDSLVRRGYVRVGDYKGPGNETYYGTRGYYVSTVGGKAAYRQGTAQTVHQTWNGVDPRTGYSTGHPTGGAIAGRAAKRITQGMGKVRNNLKQNEALQPIFDAEGRVVAYERSMDQEQLAQLATDEHMGRMLGVQSGRILEEDLSNQFNKALLRELRRRYRADKDAGKLNQYFNLAYSEDPVHVDAWATLGHGIKEDAEKIFGQANFFPIRRDMELDAVGYRASSVREAWSEEEQTRMNKKVAGGIRDLLTVMFGEKAYKRAVQFEEGVQDAVSYAKTTIVVRSLIVMRDNLVSNQLQLMSWGIGPIEGLVGQKEKFLETNQYIKNREQILELNAELAAKGDNPVQRERIMAKIKVLRDIEKNLSIAPLLEAGEFSTISESLTEADQSMRNGKWSEWIEGQADRLPSLASNAAKTLMITKDSALFKGLNRGVQYGDFIAKAVLYDHLTQTRGMDKEAALRVIREEFVMYNRLAGRGRDYLESMGLIWFFSYKVRIMKIMAKMIRERPVAALGIMGGIGPMMDIDTVGSGSLAGAVVDGGINYAVGPEMGINALTMNPIVNLVP